MLGRKIRHAREHILSLTQRELADQIGVTPMAVSRWERGVAIPRPAHLRELSGLSGQPVSWFYEDGLELVA